MTEKLACPACGEYASKVIDCRPSMTGFWRRRECLSCHARFSTEEVPQSPATNRPTKKYPDSGNIS